MLASSSNPNASLARDRTVPEQDACTRGRLLLTPRGLTLNAPNAPDIRCYDVAFVCYLQT